MRRNWNSNKRRAKQMKILLRPLRQSQNQEQANSSSWFLTGSIGQSSGTPSLRTEFGWQSNYWQTNFSQQVSRNRITRFAPEPHFHLPKQRTGSLKMRSGRVAVHNTKRQQKKASHPLATSPFFCPVFVTAVVSTKQCTRRIQFPAGCRS